MEEPISEIGDPFLQIDREADCLQMPLYDHRRMDVVDSAPV
jgi:hypothetical protein